MIDFNPICLFVTENEIDASSLPELSKEDFLQLGFKLGPALNLLKVIKKLYQAEPSTTPSVVCTPKPNSGSNESLRSSDDSSNSTTANRSEPLQSHGNKESLSLSESSGSHSSTGRGESPSPPASESSSGSGSSDDEQYQCEAEVSYFAASPAFVHFNFGCRVTCFF